ncbi:TetR family transcriptional regulator [Rhodococcus sp. NPDC060086]|uniref:TetR family transcriptional regulator n=1 Tax=Rhodococcus sp. NPDC060086 TaxID=3347055 RepID=UPI00365018E0
MITWRQQQAQATRGRLLDEAARLFADEGFASVTTTSLAEAAGMTRGALYHHFANLQEVMEAVFERAETQLVEGIASTLSCLTDPVDRLLAIGPTVLDQLEQNSTVQRIVFSEAPVALGWARWRMLDGGRSVGMIAAILTELRDLGALAEAVDPELSAQLVLGAINEAGMRVAATEGRDRAALAKQVTLLCRGLLTDPS